MTQGNAGEDEQPTVKSVHDHVAALKSGRANGSSFDPGTRQEIVEFLTAEGVGTAEVARLLGMSDRTVRRDLEAVRHQNAVERDPGLVDRVIGELMVEARRCVARIRRVTSDKSTPPSVRVDAERAVFQILDGMAERLQSVGYLPTATKQVQAELTHTLGDSGEIDALKHELSRLSTIAADVESNPGGAPVERGEIGRSIEELKLLTDGIERLDAEGRSEGESHDEAV